MGVDFQEELELFKHAVSASSCGITISDATKPDHPLIYVNHAFEKISGYNFKEVVGKNCRFLQGKDTGQPSIQKIREAIKNKINCNVILRNYNKSGNLFWNDLRISPIFNFQGELTYFVGVQTDITEKVNAELKLQEFNVFLEKEVVKRTKEIEEQATLLEKATDAIILINSENIIQYWNRSAELLYGWSREEAYGNDINTLLGFDDPEKLAEIKDNLINKKESIVEVNHKTRYNKKLILESRLTLITDKQNDYPEDYKILIINTDITNRKKLESQFLQAQKMENIAHISSGIAHDLNNLLTPILIATQIIKAKTNDPRSSEMLSMIESNVLRGADMIKHILAFSRVSNNDFSLINIKEPVLNTIKLINETFPKNVDVRITLKENLWPVLADLAQVHQVLLNLCINSKDAMNQGGTISITAENVLLDETYTAMNSRSKTGHFLLIKISDTGTGILPEYIEKIFEPFFTTKEIGKGTGLGLASVVNIIENHKGFMNVKSEIDKGTEFEIYIPAVLSGQPLIVEEEDFKDYSGNNELLLIIDDETAITEIISSQLINFGYRTLTANDGIQAISLLTANLNDIKVVIVDINLPLLDGFTLINILQRLKTDIKIIVCSGSSDNKKLSGQNKNIITFLQKPFTSKELLKTLNKILQN